MQWPIYSDYQKTLENEDDLRNQVITLKRPMSMRLGHSSVNKPIWLNEWFNKCLVKLFALKQHQIHLG